MNRAERIFHLHNLLKGNRSVSKKRMISELGASRPTVNRDIQYMREFMGAPIVYDRRANGYRYDSSAPEFELPGLWFNASELYGLLASEQLLEAIQPGILAPHLGPLKARIRRLLAESGHASDTVTARVNIVAVGSRRVASDQFGRVAGAVLEGQVLDIQYHGRQRGQTTQRRVHPLQLIHYRDNWYVVAWCERAGALRTFSLDRILHAGPIDQSVRRVDETALERCLGAGFGIFTGEANAWAVLRFSPHMARWVADETWHPEQVGRWRQDGYELRVPYSDPREIVMEILKYGPEVEVIGPDPLRQEVAERLAKARAQYEDARAARPDSEK